MLMSLRCWRFGFGDEQGSLVPLLAVVLPVVVLVLVLVVGTADRAARQARVQWAADAAALAAAAAGPAGDGPVMARAVAAANGAEVISVRTALPEVAERPYAVAVIVVVEVEADGIVSVAAATMVLTI